MKMNDVFSLLKEASILLQHASIKIDFNPLFHYGEFISYELIVEMDTYISQYDIRVVKRKKIEWKIDESTSGDELNNLIIETKEEMKKELMNSLYNKEKEFEGKVETFQQKAEVNQETLKNVKMLINNMERKKA